MPTAQPTQVIVHRIELQKTERQYLEKYIEEQQKIKIAETASAAFVPIVCVGAVAGVAWLGIRLWGEIQELLNNPLDAYEDWEQAVASVNPFHDTTVEAAKKSIGPHPKTKLEDYDLETPAGQEAFRQAVRDHNEKKATVLRALRELEVIGNPFARLWRDLGLTSND